MTTTGRLAAGGALAAGALLLLAASIAMAANESPSPSAEPGSTPESSSSPAVEPATAPAAPVAEPTPATSAAPVASAAPAASAKPAATPTPAKAPDETKGPVETLTGVLGVQTEADGDREYVLNGIELAVGPPWFWGTKNPLEPYVGTTVTVTGRTKSGQPSANASDRARAGDGPRFEVYTVNGTTVRAEGKPPWAGGPKVVGERHPGYKGWSQGQGNRAKGSQAP